MIDRKELTKRLPTGSMIKPEEYIRSLPEVYFSQMDYEDALVHFNMACELKKPKNRMKTYFAKHLNEEFIIHAYDSPDMKNILVKAFAEYDEGMTLYRFFASPGEGFILHSLYKNPEQAMVKNGSGLPRPEDFKSDFIAPDGRFLTHLIINSEENSKGTVLKIRGINVARVTLLRNLPDTFSSHNLLPYYIELVRCKFNIKNLRTYYEIECHFDTFLDPAITESMKNDFERYLQTYIKPLSIFDILGPSMVGPSSSHTAGANRIGRLARNVIIAKAQASGVKPVSIAVRMLGSFRDTGLGHRSPQAIGGGLCGFAEDDMRIMEYGDPKSLTEKGIDFGTFRTAFLGYFKSEPEEDLKYSLEKNNNIVEIVVNCENDAYVITGFSIGGGNIEVRYVGSRLQQPLNGKLKWAVDGDRIVKWSDKTKDLPAIEKVDLKAHTKRNDYIMPFNTFEELSDYLEYNAKELIDVVYEVEMGMQSRTASEIDSIALQFWEIMKRSVSEGLKDRSLSFLKLTGGDAAKINDYVQQNDKFRNIYGLAASYCTSVSEYNAKSGLIVACPTAGSCGILPGILNAYTDLNGTNERKIIEAMLIAGFFGMILFDDVSTAGADYGCQAEIGAGAAMAAAAVAYLEGGTYDMCIEAFTLAIKNSLGLICDPVSGLVEVPCVKRNGIYSSLALTSALMALSGVKSFISPDEVILTMKEVGERMNVEYRETSKAGLAKTRDAKRVEREFENANRDFYVTI